MNKSRPKNVVIKRKLVKYDKNFFKKLSNKTTDGRQRINLTPALSLFASLVLAEITYADWLMECGSCHCKWNSGKKTADCKNSSLFEIPNNLSPEVQVLDLSHNHISSMESNIFMRSHLQNLHKLYVRNSSLERVDPESFANLRILIELDLSNNLLRTLERNQFYNLVKVRAILLNNNLLESLSDGVFQNLIHLHRVELRGNRLAHVTTQVFMNLPLLSQIYLDENRLRFLRKESFEQLERLTALSLDRNPWNCSCNLEEFRHFVIQRNLYTPPTSCYYPAHLRGTLWTENNAETFVCKPKILFVAREASATALNEKTTLICRVRASSNTQITWNHNKQNIRDRPSYFSKRLQVHLQYEELSNRNVGSTTLISRLTIYPTDESDEGVYTCVARNSGGTDSLQINLLMKRPDSRDPWMLQENFTTIVGIIALGLLSIGFLLAFAACCFYKISKKYIDCAQHEHLATRGDIEESPISNSGTPVRGTNIGIMENKVACDIHDRDYLQQNSERNDGKKGVKIYTKLLLKDGNYVITYISKDSSTQAPINSKGESNVNVPKLTKASQMYKWSSKNCHTNNNRENKDMQKQRSTSNFRPDLLSTNTKDVNS